MKIFEEFNYIPRYWDWTEHILSYFISRLGDCSLYNAVYASLCSYSHAVRILRAFCESWCPTTNTLHTVSGEMSISLWDLHKLGGLPINGQAYDETVFLLNGTRITIEWFHLPVDSCLSPTRTLRRHIVNIEKLALRFGLISGVRRKLFESHLKNAFALVIQPQKIHTIRTERFRPDTSNGVRMN